MVQQESSWSLNADGLILSKIYMTVLFLTITMRQQEGKLNSFTQALWDLPSSHLQLQDFGFGMGLNECEKARAIAKRHRPKVPAYRLSNNNTYRIADLFELAIYQQLRYMIIYRIDHGAAKNGQEM